ncbi:hypothetical protein VTO73DRAFT_12400 [Trametes versicolor]
MTFKYAVLRPPDSCPSPEITHTPYYQPCLTLSTADAPTMQIFPLLRTLLLIAASVQAIPHEGRTPAHLVESRPTPPSPHLYTPATQCIPPNVS